MTRFHTVGHSTRPLAQLVALLREREIRRLVDIRRFAGSRRNPQYGRESLAAALGEGGIGYVHEPGLGGRRTPRPDSPNGYWRDAGFRGYADYMAEPEFADALARLVTGAAEDTTALMCAEAVPWRCHRQLVADALVAGGHEVIHILGPGSVRPHRLHPAARIGADGVITYPAPEEEKGRAGEP